MALPVTYLFYKSTTWTIEFFNAAWPTRLIGFAFGMTMFTIMSMYFAGESMTLKTGITLMLALAIVLLQII